MTETAKEKKSSKPIGGIGQYATLGGKSKSQDIEASSGQEVIPLERQNVEESSSQNFLTSKGQNIPESESQKVKKPKLPDSMKQQTVYLPKELAHRLKVHAAITEQDISGIIAKLVEQYLDREEGRIHQ